MTAGTGENEKSEDAKPSGENGVVNYVNRMPRPAVLESKTVQVATGRGKIYITLSFTSDGHLFEVFTNHGKAGGNDSAMAEALSRMISLSLRSGVSPNHVADQLRYIVDNPIVVGGQHIYSVPDAIAQVLEEHAFLPPQGIMSSNVDSSQIALLNPPSSDDVGMPQVAPTVANGRSDGAPFAENCPECFAPNMAYEEGCMKCYSCGFSKC